MEKIIFIAMSLLAGCLLISCREIKCPGFSKDIKDMYAPYTEVGFYDKGYKKEWRLIP